MAAINPATGDSVNVLADHLTELQITKLHMIDIINDDNNYTIISTLVEYGQIIRTVKKEVVRSECEKLRKLYEFRAKNNDNKTHAIIEVVNNLTGEIREYWNSEQQKILF